jgi:hypothetical protein
MDTPVITEDERQKAVILQEKIKNKINASADKVQAQMNKYLYTSSKLKDRIVSVNESEYRYNVNGKVSLQLLPKLILRDSPENETEDYYLHKHAINQIAEKIKVPVAYVKTLLIGKDWQKALLGQILTEHCNKGDRSRVLLRSVDNEVRGFLSDKYRRLDSTVILDSFIETAKNQDCKILDMNTGDTVIHLELILPYVIPVVTQKNGVVYATFGMQIRNSDFGDGALNVNHYMVNCVCLNGMLRNSPLRQVHLGGRIADNIQLSQNTYELDTRKQASAVRDIVTQLMSRDSIEKQAIMIQEASDIDVQPEKILIPSTGLLKNEIEETKKVLMNNSEADGLYGDMTLFKLTQAVTAVSRAANPVRKREMELIAGGLMDRYLKKS